jgi:DNA repair exonuclease SbcCD ATPase subunit
MIKKYFEKIGKLEKVYHVSDIHIRNFKRHDEYVRVFSTLREKILKTVDKTSIICLTGDIVHSKTDVTPELIFQVQDFLKKLADVCPVLLIPGNHDANLNNDHRMDSLTPIVDALNHPNLAYVKDSQTFEIGDKTFCHWSVFDENYLQADEIDANYKICLYHGSVQSAYTDIGFKLEGGKILPQSFRGFDLVLLGDIHKFQYLNEEKTIAYPGSLIQQNHGEGLDHGMLVWNLSDKSSEYIKIENNTAFYTVNVKDGVHEDIPENIPKNVYLRVRHTDTTQQQLKSILTQIRKKRNIVELSIQKMNNVQEIANLGQRNGRLLDVRDIQQQNDLIVSYLSRKQNLTEDQKDKIKEVNAYINQQLPKIDTSRNVIWNPKRFEFENMFSYGKGNEIDFTNMQGTYGIFAANASGKSTLLDAISYCIFDKCSKTTRSSQVLNSASKTFYCKLEFELNGKNYVIERDGLREKNGNVRVKVNFYYLEDGQKISLNGKERNDTNAAIRSVLGSYEDFALTTLSAQGANSGFIDMNQKDRKDLLSQFLDISVFEALHEIAANEVRDVSTVIKQYQKTDYTQEIANIDEEKTKINEEVEKLKKEKKDLELDRDSRNKKILEEHILIHPISSKEVNIEDINKKIEASRKTLEDLESKRTIAINQSGSLAIEIGKKVQDLSSISLNELKTKVNAYDLLVKDMKDLESELKAIEIHLGHQESKMNKLKDLKYDENCQYCMNNVFVKDAISTKENISKDYEKLKDCQDRIKALSAEIESLSGVKSELSNYENEKKKVQDTEKTVLELETSIFKVYSLETKTQQELGEYQKIIETYESEKGKIENNKIIQARIDNYEKQQKEIENKLKDVGNKLTESLLNLNSLSTKRDQYSNLMIESAKLQVKYDLYKMYADAVHRDGVPHDLISNTIPQLESEINSILEQLVDFRVILLPDDKNINAYIAYDNERYWPIELTSGMEKFVSSLAIRSSLINISSLPRPNFIAIDEGFGALDNNNLGSIVSYFDHLKNQFKFIMIISHIDSMRDAVDHHIEINKIDGKSKVQHMS